MVKLDVSEWLLPLETIPQVELFDKGGFTNKLPSFQNNRGVCGAMSIARSLSRIFGFPVSTLWIYIISKIKEDSFNTEGLTLEPLIYTICEVGIIPEWMLEYNDEFDWTSKEELESLLTTEMYEFAENHKVRGVVKVDNSQDIKMALSNKFPVNFFATISEEFRYDEDGFVLLYGRPVGGHAISMPFFDSSIEYKFEEFSFVDKGFVALDQTWKIDDRLWGADGIGYISFRALDDEVVVIEGQDGFKLWQGIAIIPFDEDYQKMLQPKKTVELFIDKIEYKVDGITKISDVAPYIKDGRTMVPLRVLSEGLGFAIGWDGNTREITIGDQFGSIKLQVDSKEIYFHSVVQELDWIKSEIEMDVPVEIINNRSFVPVRFVAEKLSSVVSWDGTERKVTVEYY